MYLLASKFRFLEFCLLLSRVAPYAVHYNELFDLMPIHAVYFQRYLIIQESPIYKMTSLL